MIPASANTGGVCSAFILSAFRKLHSIATKEHLNNAHACKALDLYPLFKFLSTSYLTSKAAIYLPLES